MTLQRNEPTRPGLGLTGSIVALLLTSAFPATAAPSQSLADFNGLWALDASLAPLASPKRPGPGGLARGWKALGGFATQPNTPPPLRPEALSKVKGLQAQEGAGAPVDQRTADCLPTSPFDQLTASRRVDIVQRADEVVMMPEGKRTLARHVYIGHPHPPADELTPTIMGHSVAHWEGAVLVVDTIGIRPDAPLIEADHIPQSEQVHVVERLRLTAPGVLSNTIEVRDPKVLTRPWTIHLTYHREPAGTLVSEMFCAARSWGDNDP